MIIGYARVSSLKQNLDRQLVELSEAGADKIFKDKISGKNTDRPEFKEMLEFVRSGDTILFGSLDRIGRNYEDIKETLTQLKTKGVQVKILDAPFLDFNTGNETLDKALFDMLTSMLSYIADNERKKMLERQSAGIAIAKQKGIYKGKPNEYGPNAKDKGKRAIYHSVVRALEAGEPIAGIARDNGITRKTVYRIKSDLEEEA